MKLHTAYVQATLWQFFKNIFRTYFFVGPFLIMITILKTKKITNKNMNGATKKCLHGEGINCVLLD